jgi:O-antigen/teichoic acid export membrane protein
MRDLTGKMLKGAAWNGLQGVSLQLVSFIIGIILARLLSPTEYGTVGLLVVFIAISQSFIDGGFSKALIQKQDRTDSDTSTVFLFSVSISIVCYLGLWVLAPIIANFYSNSELIVLLRVLSFSLIFGALSTVQFTLLTTALDFKSIAKINLLSSLISGLIAIVLAYRGFGVWALVFQNLLREFLKLLLLSIFIKWRPTLKFSKDSFRKLFHFGSKILASSLLNTSVNNFAALFIARTLSIKDLGFYTRGTQFADMGFTTLNSMIDSILLPSLSPLQNDRNLLIQYTKNVIITSSLISAPFFLGLACLAEPIILFLLTEKWILAAPIMQIICIARFISKISGINVNLLYVIGRTDLALKQNAIKIIIRVVLLLVSVRFGIIAIAIADLVSTAIHFFINTYYPGKIMGYSALKQIRDIFPVIISGVVMGVSVMFLIQIFDSNLLKIIMGIISGAGIYLFMILYVFKVSEYEKLISTVKKNFKKI